MSAGQYFADASHGIFALGTITQASARQLDAAGNSLLHHAAFYDHAETVALLLRLGADPHQPNHAGDTPFNIAAPRSPQAGRLMALYWFAMACDGKVPGLNALSGSHQSPLIQYAAKWCSAPEVQQMLDAGVDPFVANGSGWTPLHAAACMPQRDAVVQVLATAYRARPEYLSLQTTEPYTAHYTYGAAEAVVQYPAGATALALAQCRLQQDAQLTADDRRSLEAAAKILAETTRIL